jgi:dihydrolipoamide dehydrogenase
MCLHPSNGKTVEPRRLLMSVGRAPSLGFTVEGLQTERGRGRCGRRHAHNLPGLYAIGDLTGKMLLAHVAGAQGLRWPRPCAPNAKAPHSPSRRWFTRTSPLHLHPPPKSARWASRSSRLRDRYGEGVRRGAVSPFAPPTARRWGPGRGASALSRPSPRPTTRSVGMHILGPQATELITEGRGCWCKPEQSRRRRPTGARAPHPGEAMLESIEDLHGRRA